MTKDSQSRQRRDHAARSAGKRDANGGAHAAEPGLLVRGPVLQKTGARVGVEVRFVLGKQPVYNVGVGRGPGLGCAAQPRREVLSDEALPLPSPARVLVHDAAVIDEQRWPSHRRSIPNERPLFRVRAPRTRGSRRGRRPFALMCRAMHATDRSTPLKGRVSATAAIPQTSFPCPRTTRAVRPLRHAQLR